MIRPGGRKVNIRDMQNLMQGLPERGPLQKQ